VVETREGTRTRTRTATGAGLVIAAAIGATMALGGCNGAEPKSPEERTKTAVQSYKEGVSLYNEGKRDQGIEKLRDATRLQPDYTLLRKDLGTMLLDRALQRDGASIQLQYEADIAKRENRAQEAADKEKRGSEFAALARADFMEARDNFEFVYDRWPQPDERANAAYNLAQAYTGLGQFKRARDLLEEAIEAAQPTGPLREKLERTLALLKEAALREERLGQR